MTLRTLAGVGLALLISAGWQANAFIKFMRSHAPPAKRRPH